MQLKKNRLCSNNCLQTGHSVGNCRHGGCRKYNRHRNSLLHKDIGPERRDDQELMKNEKLAVVTHADEDNSSTVLLSTAQVYLQNITGRKQKCTALLDSGSHVHSLNSYTNYRYVSKTRFSHEKC